MQSSLDTKVLSRAVDFKEWRRSLRDSAREGAREGRDADRGGRDGGGKPLLGLVPTMGALHAGHMQLVRRAVEECAYVAVSIFVNPLQFGPNEDYAKYPRPFEKDLQMCREAGVHAIFNPKADEFYGANLKETTRVIPPQELLSRLDGIFRPGHFEGVATVVMKLFGTVEPTRAYFGQKDYQQLTIIQRMVKDLNVPLTIVPVATVRESDGLALSSRNVFLNPEQRQIAPELHRALCSVRDQSLDGKPLPIATAEQIDRLTKLGFAVQYLEACDVKTLQPCTEAQTPMVILVAGKFGDVRLIDNLIVE
jgi:pantoate--beta-alanine ligase